MLLGHHAQQKGLLPARHGIALSKEQCPKTPQEEEDMRRVPYALEAGIVSRYQSNPGLDHWKAIKHILKYLRRTRNHMLVYSGRDLNCNGYSESDLESDKDVESRRCFKDV